MLTDDELAEMQQQWNDDLYPSTSEFYWLIAQAREANALRAKNERLQAAVTVMHHMVDQTDPFDPVGTALTAAAIAERPLIDVVPYEMLCGELVDARQLLAAQAPVVDSALAEQEHIDSTDLSNVPRGWLKASMTLTNVTLAAARTYRAFLASRHPPTNVLTLISSMVVARVTTDEAGETTMEPAMVGFTRWPANEPPRYNGQAEPCDMWNGPCSCGAWHQEGR
jgi:hypothetical protein